VIRLVVIWLPVSVFWRATEESIVTFTGRHEFAMVLYGYVGVVVIMTVGRYFAQNIIARSNRPYFKLAVELLYVCASSVSSIVLWTGKHGDAENAGLENVRPRFHVLTGGKCGTGQRGTIRFKGVKMRDLKSKP